MKERNLESSEQTHGGGARPAQVVILVIDDDEGVRNLLGEALRFHGYGAVTATDVQEAEAALRRLGPAAIGLVISDIQLTNDTRAQEGYMLYQRWTTLYPALPFLLISGDPRSKALPAVRTGAVRFLAKPFTIDELLDAVQALLGT